jgi:hypothetical protein
LAITCNLPLPTKPALGLLHIIYGHTLGIGAAAQWVTLIRPIFSLNHIGNKKMSRAIFYYIILLMFTGCSGLAIKEKITDNCYFVAADDEEGCGLSYHEARWSDFLGGVNYVTLIDATVFAAGYNDDYMIVKQHPRTFPNPPDKKVTNYYILPLKQGMDWETKNGLIGPLTSEEFTAKRKELGIPDEIKFTKVLKDLE